MQERKTAIITGGASGIGRATALLLAKQNCYVHVLDITDTNFEEENIKVHNCDVGNYERISAVIKEICSEHDWIDYLFACAGVHYHGYAEEAHINDFDNIIKTNIYGIYYIVREVVPLMKDYGGSIVLMGSDQSKIGKPKNSIYGLTKGAVSQFSKGLAIDYAQYGIRVNCICPGTINTKMYNKAIDKVSKLYGKSKESIINEDKKAQLITRLGKPEEVANAVEFLLSDCSSYITGTDLYIDGGYTCQ